MKIIECTGCEQQLRIPEGIGGMVMACPSCGQKFHSDFKLAGVGCARRSVTRPRGSLVTSLLTLLGLKR